MLEEKNGKEKIVKEFYKNGKIKIQSTYVSGKKNGTEKGYHENGNLHYEAQWIDDEQDGEIISFDEEGRRLKQSFLKKGIYQGPQKEWWPNGNLRADRQMKDNDIFGSEILYHENGKVKKESFFLEGKSFNNIKEFDSEGNIINLEKCVFLNKEFKNEISNHINNNITDINIDIALKKGCAYEAMQFFGEYKGHEYTVYGKDLGKWCDTEYEGELSIQDFVKIIEDAEIDVLDNYLDFSFFPNDSWGFSGDEIEWEDNTPKKIIDEINEEDEFYDGLISESLDNDNYDGEGVEFHEDLNNILNIKVSFKDNNSSISIKWYNMKVINELKQRFQ